MNILAITIQDVWELLSVHTFASDQNQRVHHGPAGRIATTLRDDKGPQSVLIATDAFSNMTYVVTLSNEARVSDAEESKSFFH